MTSQPVAASAPASIFERWGAMAVDWTVCLVASYPAGVISFLIVRRLLDLSPLLCMAPAALLPLVYLTWGWSRGASLGMRACGIRIERADSPGTPGVRRSAARALMVYPGATSAVALCLVLYASWMGHYPSGAESGTNALRVLILLAVASTYAGSTLAGTRRPDRRALHDLATGVRVVKPLPAATAGMPPPPSIPRTPAGPISRWWLAAVPPLAIIALAFGLSSIPMVTDPDLGPALVGLGIAAAAVHGLVVVVRRSVFTGQKRPSSRTQRKGGATFVTPPSGE